MIYRIEVREASWSFGKIIYLIQIGVSLPIFFFIKGKSLKSLVAMLPDTTLLLDYEMQYPFATPQIEH
jgi:hypothetical protein